MSELRKKEFIKELKDRNYTDLEIEIRLEYLKDFNEWMKLGDSFDDCIDSMEENLTYQSL